MRISCLLPTEGRVEFAEFACENFLRQSWQPSELVLAPSVGDEVFVAIARRMIPPDRLLVLDAFPRGTSRGIKWQRMLEEARGDVVTMFGDDDWYAADRLTIPAIELFASWSSADVCVLTARCANVNVRTLRCDTSAGTFYMGGMLVKRREALLHAPFRPVAYAVDGTWKRDLQVAFESRGRFCHAKDASGRLMIGILYHGKNSVQSMIEACAEPLENLLELVPAGERASLGSFIKTIHDLHFGAAGQDSWSMTP